MFIQNVILLRHHWSDHSVSIDYKYYGINDFIQLNTNKNSTLARLHLNIALLLKHFHDLHNLHNIFDENKSEISEFYDALPSYFFASYILQPTRISKNSKTLTDNIF